MQGALLLALAVTGCDSIGSDFRSMSEVLMPPSPQEAAQWAVDTTDSENMRRGVVLLGTSAFGGVDAYVKLYRFYVGERTIDDPLVKAAAISALARFGRPEDAELIAKQLLPARQGPEDMTPPPHGSSSPHVRLAAAIGLQRIHNPAVVQTLWTTLQDHGESQETRVELAIGLGQYPQDDVFHALVAVLDHRELTVNLAALDSLRLITGNDLGLDRSRWLGWYATTPQSDRFVARNDYLYPTFQRHMVFWDYVVFWDIPKWETPGIPTGLNDDGKRKTYDAPTAAVDPPIG
ncbi:MAG: HEAT repeat domain-containing protein [Phycisphaerales bacterium]|nr:HEAT repeat domain-containing protein [Phycisphaerales bacterium]